MKQTIAALLTCHNRKEKTLACLKSLFLCDLPINHIMEVFLVDDGSTDETGVTIKNNFPEVNLIHGDGNLFWNRGMHLAWETATKVKKFDFYIWLNDDVELFPNAIINLMKASPENDAIVVGNMQSRNEPNVTYGGWNPNGKLIVPTNVPQICDAFNGNLVLVPLKVFNQIGNLDPVFPHAIGDFDYALRAKKKGIKSYIAADFSGYCDDRTLPPKWCLPEVPFKERIKFLYSPLGNSHPIYYFQFAKRHYGIFIAIRHFLSIHLRLICPRLWKHGI
jgi:GT2 family glycosyltransferase